MKIKIPKYRPDFEVKDKGVVYYVEVWGLFGIKEYDERMAKKKVLYNELRDKFGYQLIEIYPKDNLTKKFGFLFKT